MMEHSDQRETCRRFNAKFCAAPDDSKVGISHNVRGNLQPINGLRHPPQGDANGWYIWAGEELSQDPDFFHPLHVAHLGSWCPEVLPYLGLPPGWRFLIAGDYVNAWYDAELLGVS